MNADEGGNEPSAGGFWEHRVDKSTECILHRAAFTVCPVDKSLILMCVSSSALKAQTSWRDLNCYPQAFHDLSQKVYSPAFQLILLLLIPAGLKLLSLDARPTDRGYHRSSNSQRVLKSATPTPRLNPSR